MTTETQSTIDHQTATRATLDQTAPTALSLALDEAVARFAAHKTASGYQRALLSRLVVDPRRRPRE
ncbi:MAG: hypothetical protein EPN65_22465 [Pandoraea sp.]|uniref:hypothetical protein n=1 Tax=Pandoraea sp. TaxID=1883445 RepID=UPI00121965AC|nr:hypothetical protein [Pandoraea sp.]TAM13375.1 MAG: hypothetical protein EPN65_22465 [Pandoraea sp.]